jgi:hypothetical protein
MPRAEYLDREREIRAYLHDKIGSNFRIPRYYTNKPDFGDMDVVVCAAAAEPMGWPVLREEFVSDLGITQTKTAGVFSTIYRELQVDFFLREEDVFHSTDSYLSFNDVGNLIGKICRRLGLKYGEDGLSWVFRRPDNEHYRRDILISRNPESIFGFLGLSYEEWLRGFDELDDIFCWVIQSPYFSVHPYRNPSKRIRDRKTQRPTVARFLHFLEEQNVDKVHVYNEDKSSYVGAISSHFPDARLEEEIAREMSDAVRATQIKERFSGSLVMKLVPLRGKALGAFIKEFLARYSEDALLEMDAGAIEQAVVALYAESSQ